jgi:hypothetical protein
MIRVPPIRLEPVSRETVQQWRKSGQFWRDFVSAERKRRRGPKFLHQEFGKFLEGLAQIFTKRANSLNLTAEFSDQLSPDLRSRLIATLTAIRTQTGYFIDRLSNDDEAAA